MSHELDPTDFQILKILHKNARLTNKEIGEKLSKSPTAINVRIRRMQDEGYIKRYVAVLDHNKIGRSLIAFTHVQISNHSEKSLSDFESEIIKLPEVLECYHMSGQYDFILRVAVKDLNAYHEFLMNGLFKIIPLGNVQSTFVMKEAKSETAFPI